MSPYQPSDALTIIGFFLTLIGLLGSFFFVHLSDWYREVVALVTKWRVNRNGDAPDQKAGRRECRYEVEQLANCVTLITSLSVTSFVLFVFLLSLALWIAEPQRSDAWVYIGLAGLAFIVLYLGMAIGLLAVGYSKATKLRREIKTRIP